KTRNLRRDPTVVLCVLSDAFFGRWTQIEGTAQIVSLPEAMEGLVDYYRRISGEHPDWDDYRRAMQHDQRVLVAFSVDAVGPAHASYRPLRNRETRGPCSGPLAGKDFGA